MKAIFLALLLALIGAGLLGQPTPPNADHDGDGHLPVQLGGDDCDDFNPFVYPGAVGMGNNVDCDCNGIIDPDEEWIILPDLNANARIDSQDLLAVLESFGDLTADAVDLNRDGVVNVWDVLDLRQYGQTTYSGW